MLGSKKPVRVHISYNFEVLIDTYLLNYYEISQVSWSTIFNVICHITFDFETFNCSVQTFCQEFQRNNNTLAHSLWSYDLVCALYIDQAILDPDSAVILVRLYGLISPSTAVQDSHMSLWLVLHGNSAMQ